MSSFNQNSVQNVIQVSCESDVSAAAKRLFGVIDDNGSIPIVLLPAERSVASCFLTVPTGCACIVQRNGKNLGEWEPGRHHADWHYRIAYAVTKQAVTYNYSVADCATRDNVMARVDLTYVFSIERPVTFVYKLGATHFNEMLKAVSEEATRGLVRSINHTSIYELRSSAADQLLSVLNRTFKEFGVNFINATVTNVALPEDLSQMLEEASKIESQIREIQRAQEFELKKFNDRHDLRMKELELRTQREDADLEAKKGLLEIEMAAKLEEAERLGKDRVMKELQITETQKVGAMANLRDDQTKAQLEVEKSIQEAELLSAKRKREIDTWAETELMKMEAELQKAKNEAAIAKIEADAEASAVTDMRSLREHEIAMKSYDALKEIASKNSIVITGATGEKLVSSVVQGKPL